MTNEDVIKMNKGGFGEDVLVAMIESNDTDFDVSITGLTALKDAGISNKVMEAMLKAEAKKRQGGDASSSGSSQQPSGSASSPPNMAANPAASMGTPGGNSYAQAMISSVMAQSGMGGMPGMLDTNQLPPLDLISGDARQSVRASIAQIAHTETKGDNMPGSGTGSAARSMLMGLGMQALKFSALSGSMMGGPGGMVAMSAMGGGIGIMGGKHHSGPPKVTSVWALPGPQSSFVAPGNKPRFEMLYGDLVGIDPDAYEPCLVRLVNTRDNWRLVGATKSMMGQMSTEAFEKVTEERIATHSERLGRGKVQVEPREPLEPGEYAIVLRSMHPGKRPEGSLGGGAETTIFFAVWDFSVRQ